MKTAMKVAMRTLFACGATLLVLGAIVWTGHGDQLIPIHIAVGAVLVVDLWAIAFMAARAGVPTPTAVIASTWGAVIVLLGMFQEEILPGSLHWIVQVAHVAISMSAVAWGRYLVKSIGRVKAGQPVPAYPCRPVAAAASK